MYALTVLICSRGVAVPVPGAAGVRAKAMAPKSLRNASSGSVASNAIGLSPRARLSQSDRVVDELTPYESPLTDSVLGEEVLGGVVEDAVAYVPSRRPRGRLRDPIGIAGWGDPPVRRACLAPVGVRDVVLAPVERSRGAQVDRPGGRDPRQHKQHR